MPKINRIAIIPARSGSKGLKNKNIIDLCGKPLLAYSVEAAVKSKLFSRVFVSTDSKKYASIAKKYGADIIIRDTNISNDQTPTYYVIKDVLDKTNLDIDYFVLLQPTSPLRNSKHIVEACMLFEKSNKNFLVSMCKANHNSSLIKPLDNKMTLKYYTDDYSNYRRQKKEEYYPNGAIFIGKPNIYIKKKHFFGKESIAYIMDKKSSIDIDDVLDYKFAKTIMSDCLKGKNE